MADALNPHEAGIGVDAIDDSVVSYARTISVGRTLQLLASSGPVRVLLEEVDLFADSLA
jgi:hypothetical protein